MIPAHELVGVGAQTPVALIPGTFSDRRTWLKVTGTLSGRRRCLLFDPRGTGRTPDPGTAFGPDELVDDLLQALDSAGLERTHLVGHSLGATVALVAAARHPGRVDRVVAVAPSMDVDARTLAVLDNWEALVRSNLNPHDLHRGLLLPAFGREAFARLVPALLHDLDRHPLDRETIRRYIACDRAQDVRPHLDRIDATVLVVVGADDTLTGPHHARALAAAIPGARLEIIPDCGHTPQVERAPALSRLLAAFLD
ncbi:MAG: alpha/beta hydrolase [Candidatus Dormibacteraeota bacterium]|nr:alpha/beta hydrolase [Candidatus Dormibacteraeota bacterium]